MSQFRFSLDQKPKLKQVDPPRSPRETLPTMYDLPSEYPEEPGLPDEFHDLQPQLLSRTLRLTDYARDSYFTASDLNVYYDINHPLWHKRPDWFLSVNVPRLYDGNDLRRSYVVWQEGQNPYVVVEFLSPGTADQDLGRFVDASAQDFGADTPEDRNPDESQNTNPDTTPHKLEVYERYLRVPHYLVYSRYTRQLRYFKLDGARYREQTLNSASPLVWIDDLNVGLGIWEGTFEGISAPWLRWCDRQGNWFLTDTEEAEQQARNEQQARERAEQEMQRVAEQSQAQLLQVARNLLATGMELEQVAKLMEMTEEQVQGLLSM